MAVPNLVLSLKCEKITRSIYHKKVKQIGSNQKRIKKTRIAKGFLENRSRDFWSEISKIRRKTHITPCTVEGFSNNEDISSCFSSYYKDLYNSVSFDSIEWSKLLTIRYVMNVLIGSRTNTPRTNTPGHIPPDIYPLDNNPPCQIPPGHIPTIQKIYDMFDI